MEICRATTVALALALGTAAPVGAGGDETPSVETAVLARLSAELGRQAGADFSLDATRGAVAADLRRPGRAQRRGLRPHAFAPRRQRVRRAFLRPRRTGADGPEIVEFAIGGNDMPAVDWIDRHGLPADILTDP